jgi:hypothetical protein
MKVKGQITSISLCIFVTGILRILNGVVHEQVLVKHVNILIKG